MNPILSICCMVYNHEKYIRQCLDGFVMQQTEYPFEILVHDDASIDNTPHILKEYELKYPHLFKCVYQTENQFNKHNALTNILFPMVRGKYIALCEGDDFWIDESKIQLQVDFLENNPDFSFCFHKVIVKNEIANIKYEYPLPPRSILEFSDILAKHYIATCSLMFRFSFLPFPLPQWFENSKIGDIPIELMLADRGKVYFFQQEMGCYRRNILSLTSSKEQIKNGRSYFLYIYKNLNQQFGYKYWYLFYPKIIKLYLGYFKDLFRRE